MQKLILVVIFLFGFIVIQCNDCRDINSVMKAEVITNEEALLVAAQAGSITEVDSLVSEGVDVNYINSDGISALMYASENGFIDVMISLITAGADTSVKDGCGWTVLMYAAYYGAIDLVNSLIANGSDVAAQWNGD